MSPETFQNKLLAWFDAHGRKDLPWQKQITPYRVWVSEIMLQQTQVATVVPYFDAFTQRFPTVQHLAEAHIDEVLGLWSGLGYYARARNLHRTSQIISQAGNFPETLENLMALPGIGKSTAGAILSIAFGKSQPILDGNVKRVLTRIFAVSGWPGNSAVETKLWDLASTLTPKSRVGDYTQAIMDLGATVCTRSKPACSRCPFLDDCTAKSTNSVMDYPAAKPRKALPVKDCFFLLIQSDDRRILLEKRPPTGIWGGLWSLPEFDNKTDALLWCEQQGQVINEYRDFPAQRHTFSHFHLDYTPILVRLTNATLSNRVMDQGGFAWHEQAQIEQLGLPAPIKKLIHHHATER